MYCPDCGKIIEDRDKFCRYCGKLLAAVQTARPASAADLSPALHPLPSFPSEPAEDEIVLYTAKKHIMGLLLPIILSPFFITLFWRVYIAINSMFGTIFGIILIIPALTSILRYCCESLVITNKFIHIEHGLLEIREFDIPVEKARFIMVRQSFLGKLFGYCSIYFPSGKKRRRLLHIKDYARLDAIFKNPEEFIEIAMSEITSMSEIEEDLTQNRNVSGLVPGIERWS